MRADDVPQAARVMDRALADLAERNRRPHHSPAPGAETERVRAMIYHFLQLDPGGAYVAVNPSTTFEGEDEVVGFTNSARRDDLWTLPALMVAPRYQDPALRVGSRLLAAAIEYGADCAKASIVASEDTRALSAYLKVPGIELHPGVTATGVPQLTGGDLSGIRAVDEPDYDLLTAIDGRVRGAARVEDLMHLVHNGATLLMGTEGSAYGYALVRPGPTVVDGAPVLLAAETEDLAARLLLSSLRRAAGTPVEVYGLTSDHQWAIRVCREARLSLRAAQTVFHTPGWPHGRTLLSGSWF